jgi:Acetylornithine deacetylase/Succinyl-diaminopimelate desuccinylase and related deacylases
MALRADPVQATARFLAAARDLVRDAGGLFTAGVLNAHPGTPTAIAEVVTFTVDVRHDVAAALQDCWSRLAVLLAEVCADEGVRVEHEPLWQIAPVPFDEGLISRAESIVHTATGHSVRLTSGPLHDACEMAMAGIPTAMIFVPSIGGISHAAEESTDTADLWGGVRALAALVGDACTAGGESS